MNTVWHASSQPACTANVSMNTLSGWTLLSVLEDYKISHEYEDKETQYYKT